MMVTDTSGSMDATDVSPSRLSAAQAAARALAKKLPEQFRLGLVSFNNVAEQLVAPTTDRNQVNAAIDGLKVHGSTAMGDGLELGLQQRPHAGSSDTEGRARRLPAVMVLLSDGKSERGGRAGRRRRPRQEAQGPDLHDRARHPVGHARTATGKSVPVPPDNVTLRDVAETTGGRFFAAPSAARLESIYENLGTRFSTRKEKQEVTAAFAGAALVLLLAGGILSLLRTGRIP